MSSLKADNTFLREERGDHMPFVFACGKSRSVCSVVGMRSVCVFCHELFLVFVTDQKKEARIQKIINWVLFVLPLGMLSNQTQSERHPPEFMTCEKTAHQTGRRECRVTLNGGAVGAC